MLTMIPVTTTDLESFNQRHLRAGDYRQLVRRRILMIFIHQLVLDLESQSIDEQKQATMEIRILAKNKPENRLKIANATAIKPMILLISSSGFQLQEYGVTVMITLLHREQRKKNN